MSGFICNLVKLFFSTGVVWFSVPSLAQELYATNPPSHFNKVVIVVFENENAKNVYKQKTFALAASNGASLMAMNGETHPSQGNYIALIGGSTFGVNYDTNIDLNESHIGDLLEARGRDWHVYAEDYPGNCYIKKSANDYARKHNPFISFLNVSRSQTRCAKITDEKTFLDDLKSNHLADYSLYIPNLKNDGHNTNVEYAGRWLASTLGPYIEDPRRLGDTLLILTFDESESYFGNQIYTALLGNGVIPGQVNKQRVNHISLLRMIEEEWGLGTLNQEDAQSPLIDGIWQTPKSLE